MFYVIIALWVIAFGVSCLLIRLKLKFLNTSCPCIAIGGLVLFGLLQLLHAPIPAWIALFVALYIWVILFWTMARRRKQEALAH